MCAGTDSYFVCSIQENAQQLSTFCDVCFESSGGVNIFVHCHRFKEQSCDLSVWVLCLGCCCVWDALADMLRFRLKATLTLLKLGKNVIISDIDAVWLKNPLPLLVADGILDSTFNPVFDIIASRGTSPPSFQTKWGLTLRVGFVIIKSDSVVWRLLEVAERVHASGSFDDSSWTQTNSGGLIGQYHLC